MLFSLKVNLYLLLTMVTNFNPTSVLLTVGAPVLVPNKINATRKIPKIGLGTTAVTPLKPFLSQELKDDFLKPLSASDELLSIIFKNLTDDHKEVVSQNVLTTVNQTSELLNSSGQVFNGTQNNTKNLDGSSEAFLSSTPLPSRSSSGGTSQEKLSLLKSMPEKTVPSNETVSRKPHSLVNRNLKTESTNKTVGQHLNTSETATHPATLSNVMGFLQKFGYLEGRSDNKSEALYQEESVIQAISHMQRYGGLTPTGIVDNATLELLVTPRCGNKDVESDEGVESRRRKRFVIGAPGWNKRRLTYFLANWSPKIGSKEKTLHELKRAFKVWSDYAHLKFVQVPTADADIVILFGNGYHGDRYPFDGPGYTLAHAYYPYEYAHLGGDVHFDEAEPWTADSTEGSSEIDFFTVATHELGHSLGLAHSPIPGSIMFPYYKGYQANLHLDYDDILGMYQLYISRHIHDPDSEGGVVETTTPVSTTSTTTTVPATTMHTPWETATPYSTGQEDNSQPDRGKEVNRTEPDLGGTRSSNEETEDDFASTTIRITVNYDGDYETVDDHKRKQNTTNNEPGLPIVPDICQGHFDAVSVLRNELFFFKGQYVWRLRNRMAIDEGYPTHFRNLFRELPYSLTKIDAVYERPNGHIVFFSGDRYWVFNGDRMVEQNMPLSWFGLPDGLEQLDAALVWGKNKKTYFFSKNLYWRYDDVKSQMDPGYPRDLSRWRGVPEDIDAAMQWTDGKTYFFKRDLFWRFDDTIVRIDGRYPLTATPYWLGCPEQD